jgi:hypothetical protein
MQLCFCTAKYSTVPAQAEALREWYEQEPEQRDPAPPESVPVKVQQCWKLAETLSDFPLALVQASATVRFFGWSIADYCRIFNTKHLGLQHQEKDLMTDGYADCYYRSVHATLEIILAALATRGHGVSSAKVLGAVALLDAVIIPCRLLKDLLCIVCPGSDHFDQERVVSNLWHCSLLSRLEGNREVYTVHRVVQQFMLSRLNVEARKEAVSTTETQLA